MRTLVLPSVFLSLGLSACLAAERVVPFDSLSMSVTTWPRNGQIFTEADFWLRVDVSWNADMPKPDCKVVGTYAQLTSYKGYLNIERHKAAALGARHEPNTRLEWPSPEDLAQASITADDIKALNEVAQAAAQKRPLKKELHQQYNEKPLNTSYASVLREGLWHISVERGERKAKMTTPVALSLIEQYKQAQRGAQWYEKLLTATQLPKPDEAAAPPAGVISHMNIDFGSIKRGNIEYRSSAGGIGEHRVAHHLQIPDRRGEIQNLDGDWVRDLMLKTVEATAAAQRADGYSFIGRKDECRYAISAFPGDNVAELRIHPEFGNSKLFCHKALFDQEAADGLAAILKRADDVAQWLKKHQELLLSTR